MKRGIDQIYELRLNQDATQPHYGTVEVRGVSAALLREFQESEMTEAQWRTILQVFVDSGKASIRPNSMLGTYRVEDDLIRFVPRYPLIEGQRYGARLMLEGVVSASFIISKQATNPTRVLQIYPSADVLPENLLRFYIHFSAAMREGESLQHIRLVDEEGQTLDGVFLDRREELWDCTGTCLTLLFDPGRVKTGLVAHERFGRALQAGRRYRLVIDEQWRDARGEPLGSSVSKQFQVAPAKLTGLDITHWQVQEPKSGTRNPLAIRFPEPLDRWLLSEFVHVYCSSDCGDSVVEGEIVVDEGETSWEFRPCEPWVVGAHVVHVDTRLEDVAGNHLNGPFDRPMTRGPVVPKAQATLAFHVR